MLINYLKIIFRNFISDRVYTSIIVLGLSVGMAACLVIVQYIHFETSFETQYKDADRIFYTYMNWKTDKGVFDMKCHPAVGPFIKRTVPEVESFIRIVAAGLDGGDEWVLRREKDGRIETYNRIDKMYIVDPWIFDFLSLNMIHGNPRTALVDPGSVVITRSVAELFFPDEDPIGQTLSVYIFDFKVTGVIEDFDNNSTLQCKVLFPFAFVEQQTFAGSQESNWTWSIYQTFIRLQPGADSKVVEQKINEAASNELARLQKEFEIEESIRLHPFLDFHFFKPLDIAGASTVDFTGDKRIISFFATVAVLILSISWANQVNLSIARALRRAKEVGLRKVNGANRRNLIVQFLFEFLLVNICALIMALTITQLVFGTFAAVIGSRAEWILWKLPQFWVAAGLFVIISTIASGIYPALVLSAYNPIRVLKGSFERSQGGIALRRVLVLVQFGLSAFLVMSIYVISRQLIFMQTKDLGMSPEQVLVIRPDDLDTRLDMNVAFGQWNARMQTRNDVISASGVSNYPGDNTTRSQIFQVKDRKAFLEVNTITEGHLQTIDVALRCGRNFRDNTADTTDVIINETAARELGFNDPEEALGQQLTFLSTDLNWIKDQHFEIVGVVKDYSTSLKQPVRSSTYHFTKFPIGQKTSYFMTRLSTSNLPETVDGLKRDWEDLFGEAPFDYFFLDSYFDTFYKQERQFAGVFGFFSTVGIIITCMGLFALSMHNTASRAKEIGVRKSLGGSSTNIMWMFSKEYLRLVVAAALISIPAGAWLLNEWLKNYPQHIDFNIDFIIIPLLIIIVIAQLTVGYQTFRAAHANPVSSLRTE